MSNTQIAAIMEPYTRQFKSYNLQRYIDHRGMVESKLIRMIPFWGRSIIEYHSARCREYEAMYPDFKTIYEVIYK